MSDTNRDSDFPSDNPSERTAAIFAGLVLNQSQMAAMLLGAFPHPETGERLHDLDAARMFIDQLEMLEIKTKGNLSADEDRLLKQNLLQLRLMFVEAVKEPEVPTVAAAPGPNAPPVSPAPAAAATNEEASEKRFTKRY